MGDKDIFNIIENIDDNDIKILMDDLYVENINENIVDNEIKEKIRKKIIEKIKNESESNKKIIKNEWIKRISGIVAAMLIFIITVKIFPSISYALEKIPVIEKLVQGVKGDKPYKYDRGFENLIENGKYQEINKTVKYDGIEFTVNAIVADNSKVWILYDIKEDADILWTLNFYNTDNEPLDWIDKGNKGARYMEFDINEELENFKIEMTLYENNEILQATEFERTNEAFVEYLKEAEKYRITDLEILVELDKNIFNESMTKEYKIEKNISSDIANIKVEKIEASLSRTKVYLNINSDKLSKISFENLRLMDSDNKIYFDTRDNSILEEVVYSLENGENIIVAELYGGISNIDNLKLICDKINYVNKEDKLITVDLINNLVEDNNLGITLKNIEGNTVVLNVPQINVKFNEHNILGDGVVKFVNNIGRYPENEYLYEFDNLNCDKLSFEVLEVKGDETDGFDIKLFE